MYLLDINNKIIINSVTILIDSFISYKNNSLVFIFNNYNYINQNTKIDLNKTIILYKLFPLKYKILNDFTNFDIIEGINPKTYFNNRFHHEIFVIENFTTEYIIDEYPFIIDIKLNDINNKCIITKNLEIDKLNNFF